jgi:anti-sigma B factor antagonist
MQTFVNVQRGIGGTVVAISGEIDISCSNWVLDELARAMRRYDPHLMLDLSGLTFLDCAGLAVLLKARRRAENHGGSLHIVAVSGHVSRMIDLTGLQDLYLPPASVAAAQRQ